MNNAPQEEPQHKKKWTNENTQALRQMMEQKKNLNTFELAKQFHCPVSVVRHKMESLEQG